MSDTFTQKNTSKTNSKNQNDPKKAYDEGIPFNSEEEFTANEDSGLTAEDLGIDFNNPNEVFNQETKTDNTKPENKQYIQEEEFTPEINNSSEVADHNTIIDEVNKVK